MTINDRVRRMTTYRRPRAQGWCCAGAGMACGHLRNNNRRDHGAPQQLTRTVVRRTVGYSYMIRRPARRTCATPIAQPRYMEGWGLWDYYGDPSTRASSQNGGLQALIDFKVRVRSTCTCTLYESGPVRSTCTLYQADVH